jgi:S1-C subfamily serine protease
VERPAEVHLPKADFWPAYFDELAGSCASATSRLMQLETSSGLVATTSLDRLAPRFEGNPLESERWVHGIQPGWSLDILWIRCREIAVRRVFAANQVPLSRVLPARVLAQSLLAGSGRPPQVNRSVQGGPLQSAQLDFGWGYGVQARSELAFELPAGVQSFRGGVAIDRSSGTGGCVRARLFANATGTQPLWESPFLIGSQATMDCGTIALKVAPEGPTRLVLQIDPAHDGRPAGADPLDIRDAANWLDPLLELDPAYVQGELDRRLAERFFAWRNTSVRLEPGPADGGVQVAFVRNEHLPAPGRFDTQVGHATRGIVVARSFTLQPQDQWLLISAVRRPDGPKPPKLEIRIGNEPVAEYEPPPAHPDPHEVRPLAITLSPYQRPGGRTLDVEVRQPPVETGGSLEWRTFQVAAQLPTLFRVFEDETAATKTAGAVVDDQRHYGVRSIRVRSGGKVELPLGQTVAIRERPRWGEYRFLRFAIRKKGKGRIAIELGTEPARTEIARYDGGKGEPIAGKALRVWADELPEQWIVITRDLFGDFGNLNLTALSLHSPDGEAAWFDHIYLARNQDDFKLIPSAPSPEQTNQNAREQLAQQLVERVRPALVTLQLPEGRVAGGVIIGKEGEILTAGHCLRSANQDVTVRLADGKSAQARSLGISRELDLGLVKIKDGGPWPTSPVSGRVDLDPGASYVALVFPGQTAADTKPEVQVASLRRFFRTILWTDADGEAFAPGGVLFNPQGEAVGLHVRRSQFGGFLFTRLHAGQLSPHLKRMRLGEVWGAWPSGSEPVLGLEGKPTLQGLEVAAVTDGGPAAKAGVQRGDLIVRISGRPVVGPEDLYGALGELDAGQPVALELMRGGTAISASVTLGARSP